MLEEELPRELLLLLNPLRKSYLARSPVSPSRIPLPSPRDLTRSAVQEWLVRHLLEEEDSLLTYVYEAYPEQDGLGCVAWRKAFWKRVVKQIEEGIEGLSPDQQQDAEVDERILMALANLMGAQNTQDIPTCIRRFAYNLHGREQIVTVREAEATISRGTTGLRTWQAGFKLANHLIADPQLVQDKRVLELGSGAGMLACLMGQMQVSSERGCLLATDFEANVLERCRENIKLNQLDKISVSRLDWSAAENIDALPDFDLVVGADLVYDPALVPMLVDCLTRLLKRPAKTVPSILLSVTVRIESTLQLFLDTCDANGIVCERLSFDTPAEEAAIIGGDEDNADVRLYSLRQLITAGSQQ